MTSSSQHLQQGVAGTLEVPAGHDLAVSPAPLHDRGRVAGGQTVQAGLLTLHHSGLGGGPVQDLHRGLHVQRHLPRDHVVDPDLDLAQVHRVVLLLYLVDLDADDGLVIDRLVAQVEPGIVQDQVLAGGERRDVFSNLLHPDDGIVVAVLDLADEAGGFAWV